MFGWTKQENYVIINAVCFRKGGEILEISEKLRKDIINQRKNILNDSISGLIPNIKFLIEMIEANERIVENNVKLPNIAITANNKLIELQHEFERAGVSFYIEPNSIESNTVGDAIIQKMIKLVDDGISILDIHEEKSAEVIQSKMNKLEEIESWGAIKKFFFRIKCFLNPNTINDIKYYTEQEEEELNGYIDEYNEIDNQIFRYNLQDNIVESVVAFINQQDNEDKVFLEASAFSTLEKLGLKHLIPELKNELAKSNEQPSTKKSWELTPEELDAVANVQIGFNGSVFKNEEMVEKEH